MATARTSELQPLLPVNKSDEPANDLTWRRYASYGLLFTLSLIAFTLLIKGFIDAGDKDVSFRHLVQVTTTEVQTVRSNGSIENGFGWWP